MSSSPRRVQRLVPQRRGLAPPEKQKLPRRCRSGQSERKMQSTPCERGTSPPGPAAAAGNILKAFKNKQKNQCEVSCPAKISFEAKGETCQIGSTEVNLKPNTEKEKFAAEVPMSLAKSWKCSYSGLNLVNLHSIFFLLKAASLKEISMQQNWSVCAAR